MKGNLTQPTCQGELLSNFNKINFIVQLSLFSIAKWLRCKWISMVSWISQVIHELWIVKDGLCIVIWVGHSWVWICYGALVITGLMSVMSEYIFSRFFSLVSKWELALVFCYLWNCHHPSQHHMRPPSIIIKTLRDTCQSCDVNFKTLSMVSRLDLLSCKEPAPFSVM